MGRWKKRQVLDKQAQKRREISDKIKILGKAQQNLLCSIFSYYLPLFTFSYKALSVKLINKDLFISPVHHMFFFFFGASL